jgi:hypothetical protein
VEEFIRETLEAIIKAIDLDNPWVKIASYIVSPLLAGYAFFGNRRTQQRLQHASARFVDSKRKFISAREQAAKLAKRVDSQEREVLKRSVRHHNL